MAAVEISTSVRDGSSELQLAPIVLFVYNRPEHTRRTIESLLHNPLAAESELIVYSDGPRHRSDREPVGKVRDFLQGVTGFRNLTVRASENNQGLARSIIEGVSNVINEYGRVIVLEDDLVVAPYFLAYMNDALEYYADVEQVMHVSGYWHPVGPLMREETFYLRVPSSWGWATWSRAWNFFKKDADDLMQRFSAEDIVRFNLDDACDFWEQVRHNRQGKADTWAIFWYATIFEKNGLCLYPPQSLVNNAGHDGSGVHCLVTNTYHVDLSDGPIINFSNDVTENAEELLRLKAFYAENRVGRLQRFMTIMNLRVQKLFSSLRGP